MDDTGHWIEGAAGQLLKQMLHSIRLSPNNTAVVFGESSVMNQVVQTHVKRLNPGVVLVFSLNDAVIELHKTPMIKSIHPALLLTQPHRKKSAYSDLLRVQLLLSSAQPVVS